MLYTLIVKPIALAALAGVIWTIWRATGHLEGVEGRRWRIAVLGAAILIAGLLLGPGAWHALSTRPGEVAAWSLGLGAFAAVVWGYGRLIAAARRRAGRDR